MKYSDWIPCTKAINVGNGIKYRLRKHWGMNVWAGEGLTIKNGHKSGCLTDVELGGCLETCLRPRVVLQRIYFKNDKEISAILSYPNGLSDKDYYFWEICPTKDGDIERFINENEMEKTVKRILLGKEVK